MPKKSARKSGSWQACASEPSGFLRCRLRPRACDDCLSKQCRTFVRSLQKASAMSFDYLRVHNILAIHTGQIERYRGGEAIRDPGLLEATLFWPKAGY